jgi:transcriptional regulator with XRE-family HTH domain
VSNLSATDVRPTDESVAPEPVEIRRNGALSGGIGVVAAVVALAYLTRAFGAGSALDWVVALGMGAVAAAYLQAFADSRTPLLVADEQGIRVRKGRRWHGFRWEAVEEVAHQPRRGLFHDGRLVVLAHDADTEMSVPLSLSTWVAGAGDDLTGALERLADDPARVVEIVDAPVDEDWAEDSAEDSAQDAADEWAEDETDDEWAEDDVHPVLHDPRPALARGIEFVAAKLGLGRTSDDGLSDDAQRDDALPDEAQPDDALPDDAPEPTVSLPIVASATPLPLREPVGGSRVEARFEGAAALELDPADSDDSSTSGLPELGELRRGSEFDETVAWAAGVHPISRAGDPVEPLVIDDLAVEPAEDPVIGPELAAARTRLGLTVDQLADRTRIRPHVIESIEVDDFVPCGGDFYARGHLRTLARVLGVDAAPLLTSYDERHADAPIDARRVFEAELATGAEGPIRSMRGGPNWSVLIAAVMALVLIWSIAQLIMDNPVELTSKPVLNGSPSSQAKLGPAVPVLLDAAAGGTHVVVKDGAGEVVFNGDLAYGEKRSVKAAPPVHVQSSDGALKVSIDGKKRGPLGAEGQPAQNTYAADK